MNGWMNEWMKWINEWMNAENYAKETVSVFTQNDSKICIDSEIRI